MSQRISHRPPYAHTLPGSNDSSTWEPLYSDVAAGECQGRDCPLCLELERYHGHANKVASLGARFASRLVSGDSPDAAIFSEWGYLLGLWHDFGKFWELWQRYLKGKAGCDLEDDEIGGRVNHSSAGAVHAVRRHPAYGYLMAYIIAGHHAGLPDVDNGPGTLLYRLREESVVPDEIPKELLESPFPSLPDRFLRTARDGYAAAFFTRMLFSCLVDADFLATEAFMSPEQRTQRRSADASVLPAMLKLLEEHVEAFGCADDAVSRARRSVYEDCRRAADFDPGIFTLTVPTGGGKTLSSLAFALRHAIRHGKQRVIYVIPFTSIIEQNADVFNRIFDPLAQKLASLLVLEHHSNLSPEKETTESKLAAENWDAPLIVTTAVQFYESLHAARTSQCRKLHHIAHSVVILDEAQCLPVDYLKPCLHSLKLLAGSYDTSIVLCTATPPAIGLREHFEIGIENPREIIRDTDTLYRDLKRVKVTTRGDMSDQQIADEVAGREQVLVIVNIRSHAQKLIRLLPESSANFHLSALMCPAHRRKVLAEVRRRLDEGEPVRLISTQLIEAGVDVDFPCVYRSLAGIDSIGQAAGRCNRNGRLPGLGEVHLFCSEHKQSERYFCQTTNVASEVLSLHEDPLSLEAVNAFFTSYYHRHEPIQGMPWDAKSISKEFKIEGRQRPPFQFNFRTVAKNFRFIDDDQITVLIPYDEAARDLLTTLRNEAIPLHRGLLRSLQAYSVTLPQSDFRKHRIQFESVRDEAFHLLICPESHYSEDFGLHFENTSDLIV